MSDYPVPENIRAAGQLRLKNRTRRLARLVELNAPPVVIANELELIEKALWLLDPTALADVRQSTAHKLARVEAGFCSIDGCPNHLEPELRKSGVCRSCTTEEEELADDDPICQQCWTPYKPLGKDDGFCCDSCQALYEKQSAEEDPNADDTEEH